MAVISFPKKSKLPDRVSYQWGRRLFHMLGGVFFVGLSLLIKDRFLFLLVLVMGTLISTAVDFLRIRIPVLREGSFKLFGGLMREHEDHQLSGMPFYAIGCTISFILFPWPIAVLAVLYLAVGDPAASIVGVFYQRRRWGDQDAYLYRKSWAGSLACFGICAVVSLILLPFLFESLVYKDWKIWILALWGGAAAAFAEVLPLRTDDNLSLPLISGSFLWLMMALLRVTTDFVV